MYIINEKFATKKLQDEIENIWKDKEKLNDYNLKHEARLIIKEVIELLDSGKIRVAEKLSSGEWIVHKWIKQSILLHFLTEESKIIDNTNCWFDKIGSKFSEWNEEKFYQSKIRAVPGCFVRQSAYIGKNVVLMPSFINVGAYIDSGTMIDTWSTIGSCAQIGKNCHISGGVGIGGVLEPIQASPVIIENNCFIGARSEVTEGVIIREGSVLSMGVFIGASTKIIDRETSKLSYGEVPPYSVVVPGSIPSKNNISTYCAVIVKKVDEKTRSKTSINEILRD
ncbi:2,3,4,5-tetrahydropyridine-2,6-dicarboxylate N-succinyltransferase [Wolbachia endosymbiont of Drosophila simulans wNo]|uniref:2,3,4,5-tetrahydropyridine-2,6-dicarboxylate N-succinyltransferase n=1 Tax=Wolbachia TaxID=953 RepID=UPI0002D2546C|nr:MULTISPECIES: 2,3,4,5-tetrahydropyridine-2,6-dicarboxylate N-succinyltransferase [Wolbachia]AGJ98661.1 2,3,4,5-tetrahydropyridine-2,6-dicarboxylate N-succinyltransferase [Wolbachia endosymbiont of Drosophila simulans wNo]QCB62857.1 2,3,4,5-tetrahydropyridine-2,6-dicarboxylate N-succinyltransferase [Wolbachia endosymbiont of Drosophila mauritiana]QCB63902.1 2,3,4,5-tetrahydropyridine-2,6-dicarboxylate N-succinyltransferase [Wolbachia endosymbiont of Drosophila mauritiana]QWE33838.1 2,3,4,5-te